MWKVGFHGCRGDRRNSQTAARSPPWETYPIEDFGVEGLGEPFVTEHLMEDARGVIEVIKTSMPPRGLRPRARKTGRPYPVAPGPE
jgi:hypothetical protein